VSKPFVDFQTKKSVHINLTRGTHTELRTELFQRHLSMQEVFENLAVLIIEKDPYISNILNMIQESKRDNTVKKLRQTDADSIFQAIEVDNPFTKTDLE
jgi:hypothetical protein